MEDVPKIIPSARVRGKDEFVSVNKCLERCQLFSVSNHKYNTIEIGEKMMKPNTVTLNENIIIIMDNNCLRYLYLFCFPCGTWPVTVIVLLCV